MLRLAANGQCRENPMNRSTPHRYRWSFTLAAALVGAIAIGLPASAPAASYPDHLIKLIVPFGPGGPPDVARS
jgi:hypothetical protein